MSSPILNPSSLPSTTRNFEFATHPEPDPVFSPSLSPSDSGYIGPAVPEVKPSHVLRIYHCNPNGLRSTATDDDWCEFLQAMAAFSVDAICAFEINVDSRQSTCLSNIHRHCRRTFDHYILSIASSAIPSLSPYKPGGVAMVTVNDVAGRIVDRGSDEMGRWCYQTLQGKHNRKVTVITAYQVCESNSPLHTRSLTAYAQQASMLRIASRNLSPRQAFVHDLTTFIQSKQSLDHGILLLGDFNASLDTSYTNMSKLCSNCNLCDVLYSRTGRDNFKTWQRGSDRRIDYALSTDWVTEAVRSCCYEPFQFRTKGDHRNMVLDIDLHALLGNPNSHLATPALREFNSKDASSVAIYICQKHRYLTQHNFFSRLNAAHTQWSPAIAERLDRDFQRASSFAARQCKRKPNVAFVQKLEALRQEKNVLRRLISQTRTGQSLQQAMIRFTAEGWSFDIPPTVEECQVRCRHLQREIRLMHKQALTSRQQEQLSSLAQAEACGDAPRATRLRHLIAAEKTKAMYQKLRRFRHSQSGELTKLEVPASGHAEDPSLCTEWITVDRPLEIEQALRARNQRHFGQAEGTFPTVPPFSEWVNWTASTHVAELILEGQQLPSDDIDPLAKELLAHMQRRCSLDAIPATLTEDEWRDKIRAWPESTSTSPSGFHLTHSKALIARHNVSLDTPEGLELEKMRGELLSAQVSLLNLALHHQYSFERWKTVVNVMILKEPDNFRINSRLRVIHLYEHDYNLLLAIKWRLLIQRATTQNLLHPGQFGGIPGRDAVFADWEISQRNNSTFAQNHVKKQQPPKDS